MTLLLLSLLGCDRHAAPIDVMQLLLVADTGHGRAALADRERAASTGDVCLSQVLPEACADDATGNVRCLLFEVSHELRDGADTLTVAYGRRGTDLLGFPGGVAEVSLVGGAPTLAWRTDVLSWPDDAARTAACAADPDADLSCRLAMPHAHRWLPDGETLVAADTLNNRVLFLDVGEDGATDVLASIDADHPENPSAWWPNALDLVEEGGRTLLLVTYKGADPGVTGLANAGRVLLWDVTDPTDAHLAWAFPEEGSLAAVHGGSIADHPDGPLVVYAHAFGNSADADAGDLGSIGIARWEADGPPTYLADLRATGTEDLGFVRDAEVVDGGAAVLVTDSGCENQEAECDRPGRVLTLALDLPEPPGLGGAHTADHADQAFVDAALQGDVYTGPLNYPFEADLLEAEDLGDTLSSRQPVCQTGG